MDIAHLVYLGLIFVALFVFLIILWTTGRRAENVSQKDLSEELRSSLSMFHIHRHAAIHGLVGDEVQDLSNLITLANNFEGAAFRDLWRRTNGAVRDAYHAWCDRHTASTHS